MVRLILFTAKKCPKCPAAKKIVEDVVCELNLKPEADYILLNIDDDENMITALQYQVASTPSVVIDGEPICVGQVPDKSVLLKKLKGK